jgi:hypothetical protein
MAGCIGTVGGGGPDKCGGIVGRIWPGGGGSDEGTAPYGPDKGAGL